MARTQWPRAAAAAAASANSAGALEETYARHLNDREKSSACAQLRRLVTAHKTAAAKLGTAEVRIAGAKAAAVQAIAEHLRELRSELDACALRAVREVEEQTDELLLPLAAQARALEGSVARLESEASRLRRGARAVPSEAISTFAGAARRVQAALDAGDAAAAAAAGLAGSGARGEGGVNHHHQGQQHLRGALWFGALRVMERPRRRQHHASHEEEVQHAVRSAQSAAASPNGKADDYGALAGDNAPAAMAARSISPGGRRQRVEAVTTPCPEVKSGGISSRSPANNAAGVSRRLAAAAEAPVGVPPFNCSDSGEEDVSGAASDSSGSWLLAGAAASRRPGSAGPALELAEAYRRLREGAPPD